MHAPWLPQPVCVPRALPAAVQLSQGGCQLSEGRDGFEFEVEDPRRLRWVLLCLPDLAAAPPAGAPSACRQLLRSCISHLSVDAAFSCPAALTPSAQPLLCRRLLEQKLTLNSQLRGGFLEGLQEQLAEPPTLHAALRPMAVTGVRASCCCWWMHCSMNGGQ